MQFTISDLLRITATVAVGVWTILFARGCTDVFAWKDYAIGGVVLFMAIGLLINRRWGGLAGAGAALALIFLMMLAAATVS